MNKALRVVGVVLLLAALGGGGVFANASLSKRYSPEQATLDYFAAQTRGDSDGMARNANRRFR